MKDLQQLQKEIADWSVKTFGDNSHNLSKANGFPMGSQNALTGIVEEVGELNGATICKHQGRKGFGDQNKFASFRNDAIADIMIFLCDYAAREGVDLLTVLNETWDKIVSKRTLENWEEHSHEIPKSIPVSIQNIKKEEDDKFLKIVTQPIKSQTGQGWAESILPPIDKTTEPSPVPKVYCRKSAQDWCDELFTLISQIRDR